MPDTAPQPVRVELTPQDRERAWAVVERYVIGEAGELDSFTREVLNDIRNMTAAQVVEDMQKAAQRLALALTYQPEAWQPALNFAAYQAAREKRAATLADAALFTHKEIAHDLRAMVLRQIIGLWHGWIDPRLADRWALVLDTGRRLSELAQQVRDTAYLSGWEAGYSQALEDFRALLSQWLPTDPDTFTTWLKVAAVVGAAVAAVAVARAITGR